jgi:hypothetical protein
MADDPLGTGDRMSTDCVERCDVPKICTSRFVEGIAVPCD